MNTVRWWMTLRREDGNSMIEYGFIALLISVAAVAILPEIGAPVLAMFEAIRDAFQG